MEQQGPTATSGPAGWPFGGALLLHPPLRTYRDAVRLCWAMRRIKGMTKRMLAAEAGLYHPHVSDYLSDDETKRELPAKYIKAFEAVCGNSAISQWLAAQSKLTVLEELQAQRMAA